VEGDVAAGRLIPILTKFMPEEIAILAIYPHRHQLSAKVRSFIDLLAAHLRGDPAAVRGCASRQRPDAAGSASETADLRLQGRARADERRAIGHCCKRPSADDAAPNGVRCEL